VQQAGNAHHGAMKPGRSAGPPPWWVWALSAVAFACLAPATASAAPTITGGDDDIWNAARPVPSYVIASTLADRTRISWQAAGVASGEGRSPVNVRLAGIEDGAYRLVASERVGPAGIASAERRRRRLRRSAGHVTRRPGHLHRQGGRRRGQRGHQRGHYEIRPAAALAIGASA
jgi:hypothetical protein